MKSYSFNNEFDPILMYHIYTETLKLRAYFRKFSFGREDEAIQRAIMHAMTHYKEESGDLVPYLKSLARTVMLDKDKKLDYVEYIEDASDILDDFSDLVIADYDSQKANSDIIKLALTHMDRFNALCKDLNFGNTCAEKYPKSFRQECLRLVKRFPHFNRECIKLYEMYGSYLEDFSEDIELNRGLWREMDELLINNRGSKRVVFLNRVTKSPVQDADLEPLQIKGKLVSESSTKRVIKIPYEQIWDTLCDMASEEGINTIRFTIGDYYVIRTLAGSWSVINPDLFNIYDLIRSEILTNLLTDTYGRIISVGSRSMFFLVDSSFKSIPDRTVRGINLKFEVFDITEDVL